MAVYASENGGERTFAADAACKHLLEHAPQKPEHWLLEANNSGDKKATFQALAGVRGKRVSAEAILPDKLCRRYFRVSAAEMAAGWNLASTGAVAGGAVGTQGNYANALAGLYLACGQDVACVAEAAVGVTLGLIGGITFTGSIVAWGKLAEICAAVALAGEVALCGAIVGGGFAQAHAAFGRRKASGSSAGEPAQRG